MEDDVGKEKTQTIVFNHNTHVYQFIFSEEASKEDNIEAAKRLAGLVKTFMENTDA